MRSRMLSGLHDRHGVRAPHADGRRQNLSGRDRQYSKESGLRDWLCCTLWMVIANHRARAAAARRAESCHRSLILHNSATGHGCSCRIRDVRIASLRCARCGDGKMQDPRISQKIHSQSAFPRQLRPLIILDSPELSGPAKGVLQILSVMAANSIQPLVVNFRYSGRDGEFCREARARGGR